MAALRKSKSIALKRVSVPKSYDVLANQLRETILRGDISEGDPLPTERELVVQTGLSRGSVREALRMLAVEGLLQTRHGRLGGNIVTLPGNESMANAINQFVRGRRLPLRTLRETREVLEPALAGLAAQHRTDDDLRQLKSLHADLVASVGNFQDFSFNNIKWHNAVAKASGNELLAAILYSMSYGVAVATMTEEYDTPTTRKDVIRVHSLINDAIETRNTDLAERRMQQHTPGDSRASGRSRDDEDPAFGRTMTSKLTVADMTIHRIVELEARFMSALEMLPALTPELLAENRDWLQPLSLNPDDVFKLCFQSYIVETRTTPSWSTAAWATTSRVRGRNGV